MRHHPINRATAHGFPGRRHGRPPPLSRVGYRMARAAQQGRARMPGQGGAGNHAGRPRMGGARRLEILSHYGATMKPLDFLALMVPGAQACHAHSGIPASFTLAQAALESSWGARAPGFNLFGIKADKSWRGAVVMVDTHEVLNGKRVAMPDQFRAYRSFEESMLDHAEFFKRNPRYAKCYAETTGQGWALAVAAAGYATDPNYAKSLIAVMDGRNMTKYDTPKGSTK